MLILTRNFNESIKVGNDITVIVVKIHRNQVTLGIEAPRDIPVHREEIYFKRLEELKNHENED